MLGRQCTHLTGGSGTLKIKLQLPVKSNIMGEFFVLFSQHSFFEVITSGSLAWKEELKCDFQNISLVYFFKHNIGMLIFIWCWAVWGFLRGFGVAVSTCIWFVLQQVLRQSFMEKTSANIYPFNLFVLIGRILHDFLGPVGFIPCTSTFLSSFQCCLWFIFISLRFYNSYGLNFVQNLGLRMLGSSLEFRRRSVAFLLYNFEPLWLQACTSVPLTPPVFLSC